MKKYNRETLKDIRQRNPLVKFGNLSSELYTWFYTEYDEDGEIVGKPPIRAQVIGKTFPNNKYFVSRENSPHFVLEYVIDGIGHIVCDGNEYTVTKGDVYLLSPGSNHKYWADEKKPYTKVWINFRCQIFEELIESMGLKGVIKFSNVYCEELFDELYRIEEKSLFHELIYSDVLEILLRIANRLLKAHTSKNPNIPDSIQHIKLMLDQSFFRNLTIEEICKRSYLSRSYIISKFKEYYGMTPHQYLLDGKIKLSTSLLRDRNKTIKEIALSLGFYDVYHFSKLFKQKKGISPLEYRKQMYKRHDE